MKTTFRPTEKITKTTIISQKITENIETKVFESTTFINKEISTASLENISIESTYPVRIQTTQSEKISENIGSIIYQPTSAIILKISTTTLDPIITKSTFPDIDTSLINPTKSSTIYPNNKLSKNIAIDQTNFNKIEIILYSFIVIVIIIILFLFTVYFIKLYHILKRGRSNLNENHWISLEDMNILERYSETSFD